MTTAYDPVSNVTVFVRVDTPRSGNQIGGDIWVHPGLSATWRLREGDQLDSANTTMPADGYSGWNYRMETDFAVAVACTDNTTDFPYNCILAWDDRGIPNGLLSYTYFKVDTSSGYSISWYGSGTNRGGTEVLGHPSAAAFADTLWLSWKTWETPSQVAYAKNNGSYFSWSNTFTTRSGLLDPPTWQYITEETRESSLVWTELP